MFGLDYRIFEAVFFNNRGIVGEIPRAIFELPLVRKYNF